ncbi:MAG: hypothetical protein IJ489_02620 [Clostridia bacterium]|nr:hypothetical protein [Clostridia bacterium]
MDTLQNDKNTGKLVVQVSAASGAVPIEGARVIVRAEDENGHIRTLGIFTTDNSGITEPISIATPSVSESLSPGGKKPYSEITTEVTADGYFSAVNLNIPIYPGITSIQPVPLIPLPDSLYGSQPPSDVVIHNDEQRPNL